MADICEHDITKPFMEVFKALDLKEQRKALRSAMRSAGNAVRKAVASELGSKGLRHASRVAKGLRVRVYPARYGAGFMVTTKPHGKKGYHRNRRGQEKPVLMWAAEGTTTRYKRGRKGSSTGSMKAYLNLSETERSEAGHVESNLLPAFQSNLEKALKKKQLL